MRFHMQISYAYNMVLNIKSVLQTNENILTQNAKKTKIMWEN